MKKINFNLSLLAVVALLVMVAAPALGAVLFSSFRPELKVKNPEQAQTNRPEFVADEIVVKFKNDIKPFRVVKVPSGQVKEKIKDYKGRKDVEFAEPNYIAYASVNDPIYSYQWHFRNIFLEDAWNISTGDGVTVAVVDTGLHTGGLDTPQVCISPGFDFVNDDSNPSDDNGHGTHVSGTIAQATNNGVGVAGVAYDACIMPVKVLDRRGSGSHDDIANGIYWAVDNNAQLINMSLGGPSSGTLKDAIDYAESAGVVVVAASGNDNSTVDWPAAYESVIAVGATRADNTRAYYSNFGSALDIVAPGGDINVDQDGDGYGDGVLQETFERRSFGYYFFQGTSMASPHVAGVVALLLSVNPTYTVAQVKEALYESAINLGDLEWDEEYGHGLLNAHAALLWGEDSPNQAPVANAGGPYTGEIGATISFDASASHDLDGSIAFYEWDFGDGSIGSGVIISHTYSATGTYMASLVIIDDDGATSSDITTVTVTEPVDDPPSVEITSPSDGASVSGMILIEASAVDYEGIEYVEFCINEEACNTDYIYPYEYSWDTTAENDGQAVIKVIAYDVIGQTDEDSITVNIDNVTEPTPAISVNVTNVNIVHERAIFYNANASVSVFLDQDIITSVSGATVTGEWTDSDGKILAVSSADSDNSGTVSISQSLRKLNSGTYTFTVTDVILEDYEWDGGDNIEGSGTL